MPGDGSDNPQLTVGSLIGVPMGSTLGPTQMEPAPAAQMVAPRRSVTPEEGPWTLVAGELGQTTARAPFRPDGVEAVNYDNPFGQSIEEVWFDGKIVFALDLGPVDVDADRVRVAQEYQIVYAVDLDERGRKTSEPDRVPEQLNIYDSAPGMAKYSPIWQFNYVVVPRDYRPNMLRSEQDCLASGYPVHRSQDFEN